MKLLSIFIFTLFAFPSYAQADLDQYLKTHYYSFDLEKGFDQRTADILKQKLVGYKLILQAEGGSHLLKCYKELPMVWIKFLNTNLGLTHFFREWGHATDILVNKYLQTGDTSYLYPMNNIFLASLFNYNTTLPKNRKLVYFGIDFERPQTYFKALKSILPVGPPPENIRSSIDLIKNSNDSSMDCDYLVDINSRLKETLSLNKEDFKVYLREHLIDFERIVLNRGSCKDVNKNRNGNMAKTFLSFDNEFNSPLYFGELGMAHTVLINRNTASIINESSPFKDKVCVINLYCMNCSTVNGAVSNGYFKKMESDILEYFIPYCSSDFTLFDLSDKTEVTSKYRAYGQFLIIAKNQN